MKRVTVTITDDAHAKAQEQADEAGMTVAQWCAWVIEDYAPPQEVDPDA